MEPDGPSVVLPGLVIHYAIQAFVFYRLDVYLCWVG